MEDEEEERIVARFAALQQRCRELFGDLRALPHHGRNQWQAYFVRVFEAYTQVWKMQQQHRKLLERRCGLSRAQVGDMASKIGQLYYHFYLRTSDITHLRQSFSFYKVLHERNYFDLEHADQGLLEKIVRALARYAVVCLLLQEWSIIDKRLLPSFIAATDALSSPASPLHTRESMRLPLDWATLPAELAAFARAARADPSAIAGALLDAPAAITSTDGGGGGGSGGDGGAAAKRARTVSMPGLAV